LSFGLHPDVALQFWSISVFNFAFGLYAYLFTLYIEDLGATPVQIGLLIGIQGLLRIAVNIPGGVIADRYSRRKIIIITTGLVVPATLSFGLAQSWWHMLPGMLLFVLANLGTPAFSSYLAEVGTARERGRAFSMVYVVGPSAALALSPVTGGWLVDATSYRVVFFISATGFAVATPILWRLSERPVAHHGGRPASYREAVNVPVVRALGGLQFSILLVLAIGTTLLTNYLKDSYQVSVGTIGWFGSFAAVGSALLSLAIPRVKIITTIRTIGLAPIFVGILCGVTLLTGNPIVLGIAFMGRGGFMVAWSLFASVLSDTVPPKLLSRAFAFSEFLGAIGLAIAPFIAGSLYDWKRGGPAAVTVLATPLLAAAAFWIERRYVRPAMAARAAEFAEGA
jgi:MFS family permease